MHTLITTVTVLSACMRPVRYIYQPTEKLHNIVCQIMNMQILIIDTILSHTVSLSGAMHNQNSVWLLGKYINIIMTFILYSVRRS